MVTVAIRIVDWYVLLLLLLKLDFKNPFNVIGVTKC